MNFYGPSFIDKFESRIHTRIEPVTMALLGAGGASLLGRGLQSFFGYKGSKDAARTQARSATEAMGTLQDLYGQAGEQLAPYQQAGAQGLEALRAGTLGGDFQTDVPQFQYDPFEFEADPGYQFRMQQGLQGVERGAAARGGALGGGTMKALQQYGQGLASQEYGQEFDRYRGERAFDYGQLSDLYGRNVQQQGIRYGGLQNLAGIGQRAAGAQAGMTTQLGGQLADLMTGRGSALAAGQAGGMRAIGEGIGGLTGDIGNLALMFGLGGARSAGGAGAAGAGASPGIQQGAGIPFIPQYQGLPIT